MQIKYSAFLISVLARDLGSRIYAEGQAWLRLSLGLDHDPARNMVGQRFASDWAKIHRACSLRLDHDPLRQHASL